MATPLDPGASASELPPPPAAVPLVPVVPLRAGHLTMAWRIVTACAWVGVIGAFAAIWSTSVQLGLSTWWLGARSEPQPQWVRLLPFVVPLLMCIAVFNNVRRIAQLGLVAAAATAVFGLGDLGRITELAVLELIVAGLAAIVSAASLTGTYRDATVAVADGDDSADADAAVDAAVGETSHSS